MQEHWGGNDNSNVDERLDDQAAKDARPTFNLAHCEMCGKADDRYYPVDSMSLCWDCLSPLEREDHLFWSL